MSDNSIRKSVGEAISVSIVTPTLNASAYFVDCLESIHGQKSDKFRVQHLILDGGSTDGTLEIAKQYPVEFVDRPTQLGLVGAMCLGYEHANGDLVGFLGSDDLLLPGSLECVAETFKVERREAIFGSARWVDANLKSLGELAPTPHWLSAKGHASLGWSYISATASFVTPKLYRELGGFDRRYKKCEDYEFFTRILSRKIRFSRINRTLSLYRRHGDNVSMQQDQDYSNDYQMLMKDYAPKHRMVMLAWRIALKTWIYARNPVWAYHQINRKVLARRLQG